MVAESNCFHFQSRLRVLHTRRHVDCAISPSLSTISTVPSLLFGAAEFWSKMSASMNSPENEFTFFADPDGLPLELYEERS